MGCAVEITVEDADPVKARAAARAAQLELDRLDAMLSDWKQSSELSAFNASGSLRAAVPSEMAEVTARALAVAQATDGRFDPTVAPLVTLWRTIKRAGGLPPANTLAETRACVGYHLLRVEGDELVRETPCVRLDYGGIGKGYGAVRALRVLAEQGCSRALVAVAGDIAAGDPPTGRDGWTIEIAAESRSTDTESIVIANAAVSTSGGAAQFVEIDGVRYAHIVDPRTGLGATKLAQVTVVGPLDAAVDALGTALALTDDDDQARAILRRFPGYRAKIERDGIARWLDGR